MECAPIVRIKLVRRYSIHSPGKTVDCEDGIARQLITDGIAINAEPPADIETATLEPEAESADITPRRGRRKRSAVSQPEETDASGG
jgi:hypothetical protein